MADVCTMGLGRRFALAELYGDVDMRPFTGQPDNDYTVLVRNR